MVARQGLPAFQGNSISCPLVMYLLFQHPSQEKEKGNKYLEVDERRAGGKLYKVMVATPLAVHS